MQVAARFIASGLLLTIAACSSTPEDRVARAAASINANHSDKVDSAHAEGRVLVVRLRNISTANLSDEELSRMLLAGLCSMDGFKAMLKDGASIRFEVPRAWTYATINADHCDGQASGSSQPQS